MHSDFDRAHQDAERRRNEIGVAERKISELERKISELLQEVNDLRGEISETVRVRYEVQSELGRVLDSFSWRITAPLRKLKNVFS
jgi:hypothetical protein